MALPELPLYFTVSDFCINCGFCATRCPSNSIDPTQHPALINQETCRHCGSCFEVCPMSAIRKHKTKTSD